MGDKYNTYFEDSSNELDKIANQLLSGEITNQEAERLAYDFTTSRKANKNTKTEVLDNGVLEYEPTESYLEYTVYGNTIHISGVSSGQEKQGGMSHLMLKIEEIARSKRIDNLELEVWESNRNAHDFVVKRGYRETNRTYQESRDGTIITLQKSIH